MSVGQIRVVMTLDDAGFTSRITQNGREISDLNSRLRDTGRNVNTLGSHFNGLGHSFREFIVTTSLAKGAIQNLHMVTTGAALGIAKTNGEIERMTALMKGMSTATTEAGKSADATKSVGAIFDMAKNAPVDVKALTDVFVKLKTTGIDPLNGSMQALIDANAHFGGNSDSLHRASIAIQQMSSKGVISMEELRQQLAEAIPNASALMARGVGLSMADFVDKVSKGQVKSKEALGLMFRQFEIEFAGSAKGMMDTWVGLTANLETEWTLFQKKIGDASYFDQAKDAMRELTAAFNTEEASAAAASLGHALGELTTSLVTTTKYVVENREEIGKWIKISLELYVAIKSWGLLTAVVGALGVAVTTVIPNIAAAIALIVETGEVAAVTTMLAETLGISMAALGGPIAIITGLLVAGGIAWANWGDSAQESIDKATQATADGVRIAKSNMAELDAIIEKGKKSAEEIKTSGGPMSRSMAEAKHWLTSPLGSGDLQDDVGRANAAQTAKNNDQVLAIKNQAERIVKAQKDAAAYVKQETDAKVGSNLVAAKDAFTGKDGKIDRDKYNQTFAGINAKGYEEQIKGINESSDALIRQEKAAGRSTEALEKNKKELIDTVRLKQIQDTANAADPFGAGKDKHKSSNAAAKKAASEADKYANFAINQEARLAKLKAQFNQPHEMGKSSETGPEEAKLNSLIESGRKFTEQDRKRAQSIDEVTRALADQKRAYEVIDGVRRQESASQSKLIVESRVLKEQLENNGYPVMSKNSLALEERLAVLKDRLYDVKNGLSPEKFDAETKAMIANAAATNKLAEERDNLVRENRAMIQAKSINASLIGTTRERLDAEYELQRQAFISENNLTEEMLRDRTGKHKEQIGQLEAMDAQHARQVEHPLQTMARSWADSTQNMKEASVHWMELFTDGIVAMTSGAKFSFSDMTKAILADIARIALQKQMAGLIDGAFDSTDAKTGAVKPGWGSAIAAGVSSFFATGGVMTPMGKLPLHTYATGGIAKQPQVAIFGEGRQNEAYVPLPDGKTIPVTMKNGASGGANVSIVINVDGNGGASQSGGAGFDGASQWNSMAGQIKMIVVKEIANQQRPGGTLSRT